MSRTLRISRSELVRIVIERHLDGVFLAEYETMTGCDRKRSIAERKAIWARIEQA